MQEYTGLTKPKSLRPMTETECGVFMACISNPDKIRADFSKIADNFAVGVLTRRLDYHVKRVKPDGTWRDIAYHEVVLALCAMSTSPGECVMWAHALAVWSSKRKQPVDMTHLCSLDCLGMGVPTPEAYLEAWDANKITPDGLLRGDNLLDLDEFWLPIMQERFA